MDERNTGSFHLTGAGQSGGVSAQPHNVHWLADQHRKQEERRCYVCGGRDDGGCHGIDGERAECPWY